MVDDVIKLIMERTELHDFLSVPAPDVLHKNAFLHDENDLPIDCNIYHPKYGYAGFKTYSKDIVAASFTTRHSYKDYDTGETIYAPYYQEMVCSADGINFTNKDCKKVIKVDYLQTHLKRLAENEQDFEVIYQREFDSKKLSDTPEIRNVFCHELISHIQYLIKQHTERSSYKDGRDINVLALANRFIDYLNGLLTNLRKEFSYTIKEKNVNNFSKQKIEIILSEIKNSENKFWKGLPMEQVVKHFEIMTTRNNKNGYCFLTPEQLVTFLMKGFLHDIEQPIQKINCSNGEKGFVIKRFYEFFDLAVSQYGYPQRKEKFISLFTDCFDNWEPNTIEPFFKPNKTKESW